MGRRESLSRQLHTSVLKRIGRGVKSVGVSPTATHGTNFFDLPAELRIDIYNRIVEGVTLRTCVPKLRRTARLPAMLIASKQARAEYQPILLTKARVIVHIYNYDFRGIEGMAKSLYPTELKLLRMNKNLIIQLDCCKARAEDIKSLRPWLVLRADSLDRLPWRYEPGWSNDNIRLEAKEKILENQLDMLHAMKDNMKLDESLVWELRYIENGLEQGLHNIQHEQAMQMIQTG